MIFIENIDDPRIAKFKQLKKLTVENKFGNNFVAESEKVVLKLLNSDLNTLQIFAKKEFVDKNYNLIKSKIDDNNIFFSNKEIMSEIVGFKMHTGVLALAEIPINYTLDDLNNRIIILNNIIDAENVGSIIRNALGFGFDSFILDHSTCSPYLRRTVRVSMGAVFESKFHISTNLIDTIRHLKLENYVIFACENIDGASKFNSINYENRFALIFGNEGNGIENEILKLSDKILKIPISSAIDSLNVSSSSAIVLNYIYNIDDK